MSKRVVLLDDVDQSVIDENLGGGTVEFSFDGRHFTIDLSIHNKEAFIETIEPWIKAAQEVEAPRRRGRPAGAKTTRKPSGSGRSKEELQTVRDWCAKQGIEVSARGRIPHDVLALFDEAHKAS